MVTMKQIAERTGVSVSTVSLVLNHRDEGRVKADIARKVRATAQELGYQPNALARSLRTNKIPIIGFVSEEVATTPYAGGIIQGAQDAARELGYLLITVSGDDAATVEQEVLALKRYGIDAFIYSAMSNRVVTIPQCLADYPLVLADATDRDNRFPAIEPDEFRIGYDATTRLIEAGCANIAYVGCTTPGPIIAQRGRLEGYRAALDDHGREFNEALVCNVDGNEEALRAVEHLFAEQHPDGFFCFNDSRAWYVYECAARQGLIVGKDISVVGVDNHRVIAETFAPQLTTIALPHYEMGYWAADKLISIVEHRDIAPMPNPLILAPIPPLDGEEPVKMHCVLIEKESVCPQ